MASRATIDLVTDALELDPEGHERRVLVVDEDQTSLDAIEQALSESFQVQAERDVYRGLVALEDDGPFEAIICDLQTPGIDGIEFLEQASDSHPQTPRMLLISEASIADAIEAVNRAHVSALIPKPVDTLEVLRLIDESTGSADATDIEGAADASSDVRASSST